MRKWMIGGIVLVIVMGAWVLYLAYDTKRFIQSLPEPPTNEKQPSVRITPLKTAVDDTAVERTEERISETPTTETMEKPLTTTSGTFLDEVSIEELQGADDTGLSPELELLFTAYHSLTQEYRAVNKVLNPLLDRHHLASNRRADILLDELPASVDGPERRALENEFYEIGAWKKSVKEQTIELQEERRQIAEERSILLAEYGIADWREFLQRHGETYDAWKATR